MMVWFREIGEKRKERVVAALAVLAFALLLGVFFDYYYAMNDDTAIRDILSGAYTGKPEGHNVQMLYPLGLFLSIPYRLVTGIPWYGLFLCFCQFFSIFIVADSLLILGKETWKKAMILSGVLFFFLALLLWELIFIQYTVTAGLLATAALIRFFTSAGGVEAKTFWKRNVVSICLLLLSFCLRPEMMLLLCPLFGVAGILKWSMEKEPLDKENKKKYSGLVIFLAAGMFLCLLGNRAGYASYEWRDFLSLFDARTELYDYYKDFRAVPPYEENREFYESIGLSAADYMLLSNYNYGLEENMDEEVLWEVAEYAEKMRPDSLGRRLYLAVYQYGYRFIHGEELVFSLFIIAGYFFLIKAAFFYRDKSFLWKIPLLAATRSALWLFLLFRGRYPERITHPLYLMELAILWMLFLFSFPWGNEKKFGKTGILSLYVVLLSCTFLLSGAQVKEESTLRQEKNTEWQAVQEYCRMHKDSFYFMDVYSTVAYSEKLLTKDSGAFQNYELLGGWLVKSPLMEQKLLKAGIRKPAEALLRQDGVYFITRQDRETEWLKDFYWEKRTDVILEKIHEIGPFLVIRIKEQPGNEDE